MAASALKSVLEIKSSAFQIYAVNFKPFVVDGMNKLNGLSGDTRLYISILGMILGTLLFIRFIKSIYRGVFGLIKFVLQAFLIAFFLFLLISFNGVVFEQLKTLFQGLSSTS
jgi:hypothetical protein